MDYFHLPVALSCASESPEGCDDPCSDACGDSLLEPVDMSLAEQVSDLMEFVYEHSGVDFRNYAYASLLRRVKRRVSDEHLATIAELQQRVSQDSACLQRLLNGLTLPVTTMFRDPPFFRAFRELVCPLLATYPYLRLWVAGCSSGQEVYSLAILLKESGLYERSRIYATDLHPGLLQQAQDGIYPLSAMQDYTRNYQAAGGSAAFTEYYTADAEYALFDPQLRANIVFATHNLAIDRSFNEFHVVLCRNVMIYFNDVLQNHVHRLLYDSLGVFGYLGIGRSESIRFSVYERSYEAISKAERIYRKIN